MSNAFIERAEAASVPQLYLESHETTAEWPNPQARRILLKVIGPDVDVTGVTQAEIANLFSDTVFPALRSLRNEQNENNQRRVAQTDIDKALGNNFLQMELYIAGLDFATIGQQMGLKAVTVRTDINRTLQLLQHPHSPYSRDYFYSRLGERQKLDPPSVRAIGGTALLETVAKIAQLPEVEKSAPVNNKATKFLRAVVAPEDFPDGIGSQAAAEFIVARMIFPAYIRARMIDSPNSAKIDTAAQTMRRVREVWLHVKGRGDPDIASEQFASTRPRVFGGRKVFIKTLADRGYGPTYFQALIRNLIDTESVPSPDETVEQMLNFSPIELVPTQRRVRSDAGMKRPHRMRRADNSIKSDTETVTPNEGRFAHEKSRAMLKKLLGNDAIPDSVPLTQGQAELLFEKLFFPMFRVARSKNRNKVEKNVPKIIAVTRLYIQGAEYKDIVATFNLKKKGNVWDTLRSFESGLQTGGYTKEFLNTVLQEVQTSGTWPTQVPVPPVLAQTGIKGESVRPKQPQTKRSHTAQTTASSGSRIGVRPPSIKTTHTPPPAATSEVAPIDLGEVPKRITKAPVIPKRTGREQDVFGIAEDENVTALEVRRAISLLEEQDNGVIGRLARGDDGKVTMHYRGLVLTRIKREIKRGR